MARERTLGDKLLFTPYSTALGCVAAPKDSPVHALADLAGRSLGVAGGPLDKSWLMVQARRAEGRRSISTKAASPPTARRRCIAEKLASGELDAALEFWTFCVDLETRGFRRAIDMADVEKALGASGPVAMTGYVFSEEFAKDHGDALGAFSPPRRKAREALASDPALWAPIKARLRLADDAALETYRKRYARGRAEAPGRRGGGGREGALSRDRRGRRRGSRRRRRGARRGPVLRSRTRRGEAWPRGSLSLVALMALWIVAAHFSDPRHLPGPVAVFSAMGKAAASGELFAAMAITMARVAASFTLAMALGSALGYAMGRRGLVDRLADPWIVVLLNLPALVIIVLLYIWVGLNEAAAIARGRAEQAAERDGDDPRGRARARSRPRRDGARVRLRPLEAPAPRRPAAARPLHRRRDPLRPVAGVEDRAGRRAARPAERRRLRDQRGLPALRRRPAARLRPAVHRGDAHHRSLRGPAL